MFSSIAEYKIHVFPSYWQFYPSGRKKKSQTNKKPWESITLVLILINKEVVCYVNLVKILEKAILLQGITVTGIKIFTKYSSVEHLLLDMDTYAMSLIILGRFLEKYTHCLVNSYFPVPSASGNHHSTI